MQDRRSTQLLLLAALAALVLQPVLLSGGLPPAVAQSQAGGGDELFALTAPGQGQGSNVLFLVDPVSRRLAVYEHRAGGRLELVTVRNVEYELRVEDQWPREGPRASIPSVKEIKKE